ncbi:MAG: RelA/SpoT family protein [bacterium]|nr:RelA/SpoT family protein [bacterium]
MDRDLEKILSQVKDYNSSADFAKLEKAYDYAQEAHAGQLRRSGDTFFSHLLATAEVLVGWKLDTVSIVAGLLHDSVEDAGKKLREIEKLFDEDVALIVDGVTKIGEIKLRGNEEEAFVENLRKMILVMAKDLRVVLVKLADRSHNMQTLSFLPVEKQQQIARETLEVYAPLAERLGIGEIKGKLEDLAFPYVYPKDYEWVKEYSSSYYHQAQEYLGKAKKVLKDALEKEEIEAKMEGRGKHLYSLWCKLLRPEVDRDITKIYDLTALRLITNSVRDCYAALGVVHKIWKPIPAVGIRDFIAQPKPNGYRSVHTTVFGIDGRIIEVQIRTREMHEAAENGIAAHWNYAHHKQANASEKVLASGVFVPEEKLVWVKQLVAWQREIVDSHEYLNALKFDALRHRIFVFSPKGDAFDLPAEATPVDFAYSVHTGLGNKVIGARVNGRMVPLEYKLKSGEMVEIIVDKNKKKPSRDWLNFVVTQTAKKEITRHS